MSVLCGRGATWQTRQSQKLFLVSSNLTARTNGGCSSIWLEQQVVTLKAASSNLVIHPKHMQNTFIYNCPSCNNRSTVKWTIGEDVECPICFFREEWDINDLITELALEPIPYKPKK